MAEIKSTLDLVMEKTRHLRLSREEKEEQKVKAFKKKLNGLLQQYGDKTLDMKRFRKEFYTLGSRFDLDVKSFLKNEILDKMTLAQPNSHLMDLLEEFCGGETEKLASVISAYQAANEAASKKIIEQIKADLAKNQHISGTVVMLNLDADSKWHSEVQRIWIKFEQLLNQEKGAQKTAEY